MRRDATYDEDFVFVPPQLYLALVRWHGDRGAPIARRVATDDRGRPNFEAHAARCVARYQRGGGRAVVVPVLRHEPVHVVAARAFRALEAHGRLHASALGRGHGRRLRVYAARPPPPEKDHAKRGGSFDIASGGDSKETERGGGDSESATVKGEDALSSTNRRAPQKRLKTLQRRKM